MDLKAFAASLPDKKSESKMSLKDFAANLPDRKPGEMPQAQKGWIDQAEDMGLKGVEGIAKGLGYIGGATRVGIANAGTILSGAAPDEEQQKDFDRVVSGNAPTTKEYMQRNGVPQWMEDHGVNPNYSLSDALEGSGIYTDKGDGWSLKKGGALDPTVLGTIGTAGDIASDPLTWASAPLSVAAKAADAGRLAKVANAVVNPLENITSAGKSLYRSGLKNIDTRLMEKGQAPVSDYLMNQGVWGRMKSIQEGMQNRLSELGEKRKGLYQQLDDAGAKIDPYHASQGAQDYINSQKENPLIAAANAKKIQAMQDSLDATKNLGPVSVQTASDFKSKLYDMLPDSAFDQFGRLTDDGKQMLKAQSLGYKNEIEGAGNFVKPGLGDDIEGINKEMGAYLNAEKPTRTEIAKADRKNWITEVKAGLAKVKPISVPFMYGAQMVNSPAFRTGMGLLMKNAGEKGSNALTNAVTRSIYESLMNQEMPNNYVERNPNEK